jgi:hypothetical protein
MLVRSFCAWPRQMMHRSTDKRARRGASRAACQHHAKHSIAPHIDSRIAPNTFTDMDEPPRKRRKTSSPVQQGSSPLRKPPRRPSFASPTKASIARNYPNLLPTRTPPGEIIRSRGEQARRRAIDKTGTSDEEKEDGAQEHTELGSSPPQRGREDQERPRQAVLFSSPTKRPLRPNGALRRPPIALAPSVQQNQLTQPVEDALDEGGQQEKSKKPPLDPELEKRRQEKTKLQRAVEELEAQVARCTNEIAAEQQRAMHDALLPSQRADFM